MRFRKKYPVSYQQENIWTIAQIQGESTSFNIVSIKSTEVPLNISRLSKALKKLIKRHNILKSYYLKKNNITFCIKNHINNYIKVYNTKQSEVLPLIKEISNTNFNLEKAPLFNFSFLQTEDRSYFILCIHHIIADGFSINLWWEELSILYNDNKNSRHLSQNKINYYDYINFQRYNNDSHNQFWNNELSYNLPVYKLLSILKKSTADQERYKIYSRKLSANFFNEIKQFSIKNRVPAFSTLFTAFSVLLYEYTLESNFAIATIFSGRNKADFKSIFGLFMDVIPVFVELDRSSSLIKLLKSVNKKIDLVYENQHINLREIIYEGKNQVEQNRNVRLTHMLFNMVSYEDKKKDMFKTYHQNDEKGNINRFGLELSFTINDYPDHLELIIEYYDHPYNHELIRCFADQFLVILEQLVNNPESLLSEINIISDSINNKFFIKYNNTKASYPSTSNILSFFKEQIKKQPSGIIASYMNKTITYSELDLKSDNLAAIIKMNEAYRNGKPIGLFINHSLEMLIGIIGIIKAGNSYVPFDFNNPDERIKDIMNSGGINLLVSVKKFEERLANYDVNTIYIDKIKDIVEGNTIINKIESISPDDTFSIMYTSGSTGNPKGVMICHKAVINRIFWMKNEFSQSSNAVIAIKTPLNFVDSICEIFYPLVMGIKMEILSFEDVHDPKQLLTNISEKKITQITLVPSLLKEIIKYSQITSGLEYYLKYVYCSGEELTIDLVKKWYRLFPNIPLINIYGSTEVTADVTFYNTKNMDLSSEQVPLGRPLSNCRAYILNKYLKPVPVGVEGDIYISGDCLSKGYYNNKGLTDNAFVPNPFNKSELLYKMGDKGKLLFDMNLYYQGREDSQIQFHGYRIELGEIERAIKSYHPVKDTVVIFHDNLIIAFIISNISIPSVDIRQFLKSKLPVYMIPNQINQVDYFPLNANNKVDRKSFAKMIKYEEEIDEDKDREHIMFEKTIIKIWQNALKIKDISLNDNFFDLGGHSLLTVLVMEEMEKKLKVRPAFNDFINLSLKQFIDTYHYEYI